MKALVHGLPAGICLLDSAHIRHSGPYSSSKNLEEISLIEGCSEMPDPTSRVTNGPTPSEVRCLKSAAGCSLTRSVKSRSRDSIRARSSPRTTSRHSGSTRKRRRPCSSLSTSTMSGAAPDEASLQACGLYSRAQNSNRGSPSASRWDVFKSMGPSIGINHCIDNILQELRA